MFTRSTFKTLALALAIAIGTSSFALPHAQAQQPAPERVPNGIAVVNLVQLFNGLEQKKDNDDALKKLSDDLTDQGKKKQAAIEKLQGEIRSGLIKPDSPDGQAQQEQLLQMVAEYKAFLDVSQQKLFIEQRIRTEALYKAINDAVAEYAKSHNIALVFVSDDPGLTDAANIQEMQSRIANRKLLYVHTAYDITAALKNDMNAKWALNKR